MQMNFHGLEFVLKDNRIYLKNIMNFNNYNENDQIDLFSFLEIQIAGENHPAFCGAKQLDFSETHKLKYISFAHKDNHLEIVSKSDLIAVTTHFVAYNDCNVIRTWNVINNNTENDVIIENVSSLRFNGIGKDGTDNLDDIYLYKFHNSWHVECQVERRSLKDYFIYNGNRQSMKRLLVYNTGSWSTKQYLPQAIIEDSKKKLMFFFQIESNTSWSYEIGDCNKHIYLNASGPNMTDNCCSYLLKPNGEITTKCVAFCVGKNLDEVFKEITLYRRHIAKTNIKDINCPIIFNEYMHLAWDNPNEDRTKKIASAIKDFDIDYYVIDCGWHDECKPDEIYLNCGKWKESLTRYPSGIRKISDYIKSNGMNLGLWIEPEIIGYKNQEMIDYYGDDAFFKRNGKNVIMSNRMFLDFRNKKVINYLNHTFTEMIENFNARYIKMDYNQDCGFGTETNAITLGEGLVLHSESYFKFVDSLQQKYPAVIFETCSSGGCRMDYETLSHFSLCSTSDQTDYKKYPWIVSNIFSAVLPEQAGIWSYPVDSIYDYNSDKEESFESVNNRVTDEQIIMNMINAMLGRMHLSSAIHLLNDSKKQLIKEGILYYRSITKAKLNGYPIFPLGFSHFGDTTVASGIISNRNIYLAIWNLNGKRKINIPLKNYKILDVKIAYPSNATNKVSIDGKDINIEFSEDYQARLLEIKIG